jgi:two-component system, OmpR family, aerobic respiration control sensor histidine kinase ArcB
MQNSSLAQEKLLLFFENASNLFIELSPECKIILLNDTAGKFLSTLLTPEINSFDTALQTTLGLNKLFETEDFINRMKNNKKIVFDSKPSDNLYIKWHIFSSYLAGGQLSIYLMGEDLSALHKAKNDKASLETMIAHLPGNVYWMDKNCIHMGCNNNVLKMLGLARDEYVGKTYEELAEIVGWTQGEAKSFKKDDMEVLRTGYPKANVEEPLLRHIDGSLHYYLTNRVPMHNENGTISGVAGISVDITERKQMETELREAKEEAEEANNAKTEFLENMRHDIRTPLTGIVGFANIIAQEINDEKIKEYVDNLTASSQSLENLLNEILEVIRIGAQETTVTKKKFDLKEEITDVFDLNRARASHKHLDFSLEYDNSIPSRVIGDPMRTHRIVLELVANALNFTDKGSVKIKTELAKQKENNLIIKITVSDTGIGIPFNKQEEIFQQFKKLTPSYKGIYKGVGFGLSIVKQYVNELEGEIYVDSYENGSTFICLLPLKKPLLEEEEEEVEGKQKEISIITAKTAPLEFVPQVKSRKKGDIQPVPYPAHPILVVEDQAIAAKVAKIILTGLNCQVDVAENGRTALELFNKHKYDIIFMDIGLPDIDGYEVTRRIRLLELYTNEHIPIIALTAHVDEENKEHCINSGMNAVLSKPLNEEKARDIISNFIPYYEQVENVTAPPKKAESPVPEGKIIDFEAANSLYRGKNEVVVEMLNMFVDSFKEEELQLQEANEKKDWATIKAIAHKLKGGSSYCGTLRLKNACAQLETAIKEKRTDDFSRFYDQMLKEMNAVKNELKSI